MNSRIEMTTIDNQHKGYVVLPQGHRFHGILRRDINKILELCVKLKTSVMNNDQEWVIGWHDDIEKPFEEVLATTIILQQELDNKDMVSYTIYRNALKDALNQKRR